MRFHREWSTILVYSLLVSVINISTVHLHSATGEAFHRWQSASPTVLMLLKCCSSSRWNHKYCHNKVWFRVNLIMCLNENLFTLKLIKPEIVWPGNIFPAWITPFERTWALGIASWFTFYALKFCGLCLFVNEVNSECKKHFDAEIEYQDSYAKASWFVLLAISMCLSTADLPRAEFEDVG